jgi:hypothetical protein
MTTPIVTTRVGGRGRWRATARAVASGRGDRDRMPARRTRQRGTPAASTARPARPTCLLLLPDVGDTGAGPRRTANRTGRRRIVIGMVLLSLLAAVGCGHADRAADASAARQPTASSGRSAGSSPSVPLVLPGSDERARILADYRRFWAIAVTVSRRAPDSWRSTMSAVAAEPLLSELLDGIAEQYRKGLVDYGAVVPRPRVVQASADRASVLDCQDASKSGALDIKTGIVKAAGSARTPMTCVLTRGVDGRWRVSEAMLLDGTC